MARLAVLSYHTSPLAQPGTGDGGGMNVYVRELSSAFARLGHDQLVQRLETQGAEIRADPASRMPFGDTDLPKSDQLVIADYGVKNLLVRNFAEGLRTSIYGWVDDTLSFLAPWDFRPADISVPVHLWHGLDDIFSPVSHTFWLAEQIKHADVSIEPGAAHFGSVAVLPEMLRWLVAETCPPSLTS